jgi:hypothetical protein
VLLGPLRGVESEQELVSRGWVVGRHVSSRAVDVGSESRCVHVGLSVGPGPPVPRTSGQWLVASPPLFEIGQACHGAQWFRRGIAGGRLETRQSVRGCLGGVDPLGGIRRTEPNCANGCRLLGLDQERRWLRPLPVQRADHGRKHLGSWLVKMPGTGLRISSIKMC